MGKAKVYLKLDKNWDTWTDWLKSSQRSGIKHMNNNIAHSVAIQGFNHAAGNTPRNTGRLAQSMNVGAPESYVKIDVKPGLTIVVYGSCVPYAADVEYGHAQKNGRFVPGYWSSGTFHYQPGYKTGMVLTGKVIEGKHMFEKSLDQLRDNGDLKKIILGLFEELWDALISRQGPVAVNVLTAATITYQNVN